MQSQSVIREEIYVEPIGCQLGLWRLLGWSPITLMANFEFQFGRPINAMGSLVNCLTVGYTRRRSGGKRRKKYVSPNLVCSYWANLGGVDLIGDLERRRVALVEDGQLGPAHLDLARGQARVLVGAPPDDEPPDADDPLAAQGLGQRVGLLGELAVPREVGIEDQLGDPL